MSATTKQISMDKLIQMVLTSDKFQKTIRSGEVGYYDIQEKVFVPAKFIVEFACSFRNSFEI